MTSPQYSTIIIDLASEIDLLTKGFVKDGYNALASYLSAPLASVCIIYIILKGYGITTGTIKASMKELYRSLFLIGFIYFFAMNWGNFSSFIVDLFVDGVGGIGTILMKAAHGVSGFKITNDGIMGGLQQAFSEVIRLGAWTAKQGGVRNLQPFFIALIIYACGIIIGAFALIELIVAKLMLSLCFCTGPFFFILLLFKETKPFFDRWLGFIVGFSLISLFVSAVLGLFLSLIHWSIRDLLANQAKDMGSTGWIPLVIVSVFCFFAIKAAVLKAKHIGGACHTSNGSSMAAGLMGGVFGGAMGARSLAEQSKNLTGKMIETAKSGLGSASNMMKSIQSSMRKGE